MISRVLGVGVAAAAMLTVASVCPAAEPGTPPGSGGVGGQIGGSYFRLDRAFGSHWFGDYSAGAQSRFSFAAHWRYTVNSWFRWQAGPGLTWAAYDKGVPAPFTDLRFPADLTKEHYLTLFLPVSVQAQYVVRRAPWLFYGGAGPGLYRIWVENEREVIKDPMTLKIHRGLYPGASAQLGVERFFKDMPSTSVEFALAGHLAFATRDEQFKSGFNSNLLALEARIGASYYFHTGERTKKPPVNSGAAPTP